MEKSLMKTIVSFMIALTILISGFEVDIVEAKSNEEIHIHIESVAQSENIINPTCTEDGSHDEVIYCIECGEEISREHVVDKLLGHDYDYAAQIVYSTCTEDGYKLDVCMTCGYVQKRYSPVDIASGHIYENGECIRCGEKDSSSGIDSVLWMVS